jgi:hypothetical protein
MLACKPRAEPVDSGPESRRYQRLGTATENNGRPTTLAAFEDGRWQTFLEQSQPSR